MDISLISQLASIGLVSLWVCSLAYRLKKTQAPVVRGILGKLLLIVALLVVVVVGAQSTLLWLHILGFCALYYSLLLTYFCTDQTLTNKTYYPILKNKLFWCVTALIGCAQFISYLDRNEFNKIPIGTAFHVSPIYFIDAFFNYGLVFFIILLIIRLYWYSLQQHSELSYFVRRIICLSGYILAAFCIIVIEYRFLLLLLYGPTYNNLCDIIVEIGLSVIAWIQTIGFTIPQSWLKWLLTPLEKHLTQRRRQEQELLEMLHRTMLQIVPSVHLPHRQARELRILIEISDARQIIWSHIHPVAPITAKEEAIHLYWCLRHGIIINIPGEYQPSPTYQSDVIEHNLAVARYMQEYLSKKWIRSANDSKSLSYSNRF